jgi:hypothetical protein
LESTVLIKAPAWLWICIAGPEPDDITADYREESITLVNEDKYNLTGKLVPG